jgi:hypothetical protein
MHSVNEFKGIGRKVQIDPEILEDVRPYSGVNCGLAELDMVTADASIPQVLGV